MTMGQAGIQLWHGSGEVIGAGGNLPSTIIQVPRERSQMTLLLNVTANGPAGGGSGFPALFYAWFDQGTQFDPATANPWDGRAPGDLVPFFVGTASYYLVQFPAEGPTMAFTLANFGPAPITIDAALTAARMR